MNQLVGNLNIEEIERDSSLKRSHYYFVLFENLNNLEVERCHVLGNFKNFLKWNKQTEHISEDKLQKLWMKLIKKYKFSIEEWETIAGNTNIHSFLVKERGHGLQKLMRFYKDRHGLKWLENAFEYGMTMLIKLRKMSGLEIFFLTNIICYKWQNDYLKSEEVNNFFCSSKNGKVKEVYDSFIDYKREYNLITAIRLYKLLSKYNPQFNINATATPEFYKDLSLFIGIE